MVRLVNADKLRALLQAVQAVSDLRTDYLGEDELTAHDIVTMEGLGIYPEVEFSDSTSRQLDIIDWNEDFSRIVIQDMPYPGAPLWVYFGLNISEDLQEPCIKMFVGSVDPSLQHESVSELLAGESA